MNNKKIFVPECTSLHRFNFFFRYFILFSMPIIACLGIYVVVVDLLRPALLDWEDSYVLAGILIAIFGFYYIYFIYGTLEFDFDAKKFQIVNMYGRVIKSYDPEDITGLTFRYSLINSRRAYPFPNLKITFRNRWPMVIKSNWERYPEIVEAFEQFSGYKLENREQILKGRTNNYVNLMVILKWYN